MYQKISSLANSIIYSGHVKHKSNTTRYNKKGRTERMVPITKYEQEQNMSEQEYLERYSFGLAA